MLLRSLGCCAFRKDFFPALRLSKNLIGRRAAQVIAGVDGAFKAQNRIHIGFNLVAEALEDFKRELFEAAVARTV